MPGSMTFPSPPQSARPCLNEPSMPADPECSEFIPGEDLCRVCAGHGVAHLAGGDPGPGVLVPPQDDLYHACCVLGPSRQGHSGIIVGSHGHIKTGETQWPLHVLELIFVGCGDVDSLWMEGRREGVEGAPGGICLSLPVPRT